MYTKNTIPFESLNFHDCKIYAWGLDSFQNKFLMDIDFITQWIGPENGFYKFGVLPATLVFENVWDISIDISLSNIELYMDGIEKSNPAIPNNIDYLPKGSTEYTWKIFLQQGVISFKSIGLITLVEAA